MKHNFVNYYRPMGEGKGKQKMRQGKTVRLNINARERRRMHDLVIILHSIINKIATTNK